MGVWGSTGDGEWGGVGFQEVRVMVNEGVWGFQEVWVMVNEGGWGFGRYG